MLLCSIGAGIYQISHGMDGDLKNALALCAGGTGLFAYHSLSLYTKAQDINETRKNINSTQEKYASLDEIMDSENTLGLKTALNNAYQDKGNELWKVIEPTDPLLVALTQLAPHNEELTSAALWNALKNLPKEGTEAFFENNKEIFSQRSKAIINGQKAELHKMKKARESSKHWYGVYISGLIAGVGLALLGKYLSGWTLPNIHYISSND